MKTAIALNDIEATSVDESIVMFSEPLYIVGTRTRQWNGTLYDLETTDISQWDGTVTADHSDKLKDVIGKAIDLRKREDGITISGIKYAIKENPLAILAKNLLLGGFATGFSCETIGPDPDDEGIWHNHSLCGLSQVSHPNDKLAYAVVSNSIKEAKQLGYSDKVIKNSFQVNKVTEEDPFDYEKIMAKILLNEKFNLVEGGDEEEVSVCSPLQATGEPILKAIFDKETVISPRYNIGPATAKVLSNVLVYAKYYYDLYLQEHPDLDKGSLKQLSIQAGYYSRLVGAVTGVAIGDVSTDDHWQEDSYRRLRTAVSKLALSQADYIEKIEAKRKLDKRAESFRAAIRELDNLTVDRIYEDIKSDTKDFSFKKVTEKDGKIVKADLEANKE